MTTLPAPKHYPEPILVEKGGSFKLRVPLHDGVRTAAKPDGADVDVSAATKKGILRVYKPDGTTNVAKDTSQAGEGTKTDVDSLGYEHAFDFYIADSVTTTWLEGVVAWEVEYQDTDPTVDDIKVVATGSIEVREKTSAQ